MIVLIIYIHTVILPSTGNIPFACEQKKQRILDITITQIQKIWRQTDQKLQNMERYKVLSETKVSHRNHKKKLQKKTTSIIVPKITVLYFQSKVVPIIWFFLRKKCDGGHHHPLSPPELLGGGIPKTTDHVPWMWINYLWSK